jgi:membrane-bound lytic murein transglycosylase A
MALIRLRPIWLLAFALTAAAAIGGLLWWWLVPSPGPLRLTPVGFADLPGWQTSDPTPALSAFRRTCTALEKISGPVPGAIPGKVGTVGTRALSTPAGIATKKMGGAGYAGDVSDWLQPCSAIPATTNAKMARTFFQNWFEPVRVSAGRVREGLFTGYYEPEIRASHTAHGPYQTPVYGVPDDLITVDLGQFRPGWAHEKIAGRLKGRRLLPYPDRAAIDAKGLRAAPVLFYAKDPVAVFFLHIQGSGRVLFDDGSAVRVAYAAQNGQPYTAIGRTLIKDGAIPRDQISLQSIRAWLKAHPGQARRVMETNRAFVFFKEEPLADPALGANGSEDVPLTPAASLAVDLRLHPLGAPFYVAATAPDADANEPDRTFDRLLIAQDTGGAIRGPVRGDVYWGFGKDAASIAGRMKARGGLFVLLPKPVAKRLGTGRDFPGGRK